MTWIVGTPLMFGYGCAVSDIRVTLANNEERDCLQKIYPVGRFLASGFAGSVRIGFAMLETLSSLLNAPEVTEHLAWDPAAVSQWWPADARDVFSKFSKKEKAAQSHLMLVGASPTEHNGNEAWPRTYVYIFRSPDFQPEPVPVWQVGSIGSGSVIEPCRAMLERLDRKQMTSLMQGEMGQPGGTGQTLGWSVTTVLKDTLPRGISPHLHYCWVFRGRIDIQTNNHSTYGPWSSFPIGLNTEKLSGVNPLTGEPEDVFKHNFTMPPVARSWEELQKLLSAEGATAEGATT